MSKILGLDLGTNSLGWAVVENTNGEMRLSPEKDQPTKGVIIFPKGVKEEKGTEKSRAAERRDARASRRLNFRRKLRKYNTLKVLADFQPLKLCPIDLKELEQWRVSVDEDTDKKRTFKSYPKDPTFLKWLQTQDKNIDNEIVTKKNPYYFRDKFSRGKEPWETDETTAFELGRAFYHLAQRRGFKSNRLEVTDENIIEEFKEAVLDLVQEDVQLIEFKERFDEEIMAPFGLEEKEAKELDDTEKKIKSISGFINKTIKGKTSLEEIRDDVVKYLNRRENLGKVKGNIKELTEKMEDAGCATLGQYFWKLYKSNRHDPENKIRNNYTSREEHYLQEFRTICTAQKIPDNQAKKLMEAIFYQRPLKSQKGSVGKCSFEPKKPRCPISKPEFEEFRMWGVLNSIKIKTEKEDALRPLTNEEVDKVLPKFYRLKPTFKLKELTKALYSSKDFSYYKSRDRSPGDILINFDLNTTISGCPTSAALKRLLGSDWKEVKFEYEAEDKHGKKVLRTADYRDLWHVLATFEDTDKLKDFARKKLNFSTAEVKQFSRIKIPQGYSSLSLKAIKNITPWLRKERLVYSHAVFMAKLPEIINEKYRNDERLQMVKEELVTIIKERDLKLKITKAINNIIADYKDNNYSFSLEAKEEYKEALQNQLNATFGKNAWERTENKESILETAFEKLTSNLEAGGRHPHFIKIQTLEDEIKEFLLETGYVNEKEINKLYHPSQIENFQPEIAKDKKNQVIKINDEVLRILPLPITDAIKNPVLMRAMHQLRKLINELLKTGVIDKKTRIHLEMARELNDSNKRDAWKKWQDNKRDEREKAVEQIKECYKAVEGKEINPTKDDVTRYLLWLEQDKREIYEADSKQIGISEIVGDNPDYDIEHTIPRSRSWDNSFANKTLCSKKFNRNIKRNKIPSELDNHQEILSRVENWKRKVAKLKKDINNINTAGVTDVDLKNRLIQKRHELKFEYEYWQKKYNLFTREDVPDGFKNSQLVDTGLITRFAREYLSCLFKNPMGNSNVFVVNGVNVAEFRKAWGLQEYFGIKSRTSHIHHCIDAVTVACMTKYKHDEFVRQWRLAEETEKGKVKERISIKKPWDTFTEDVKALENEILTVHVNIDNTKKQTKRKLRKRGIIQYNKAGKTIYLQGDSARGPLHLLSYYGAIQLPERDNDGRIIKDAETGKIKLKKDKSGKPIVKYVKKVNVDDLTINDINNIVDPFVKAKIEKGKKQETILKKEIETLKKKIKKASTEKEEHLFREEINAKQNKINNGLYNFISKNGKIPINTVRVISNVSEPLENFKKQRDIKIGKDGQPIKPHKTNVYVQNESNYGLILYENKARTKRSAEVIKLIEAAEFFKLSNRDVRKEQNLSLFDENIKEFSVKGVLKPGVQVILYDKRPDEIQELTINELNKRLFYVRKTSKDGRVTFQHQLEARNDKALKDDYIQIHNNTAPSSLTKGISKIEFGKLPVPRLLLSPKNQNLLIEGFDFNISILGKIKWLKSF